MFAMRGISLLVLALVCACAAPPPKERALTWLYGGERTIAVRINDNLLPCWPNLHKCR